jgi:CO/xanthine dehydrogenase FAD-binding subunit
VSVTIAATLGDALEALERDADLRPIAGGVGVMLERALGAPSRAPRWLGVARVPELRASALLHDGTRVIGAAVTLDELAGTQQPSAGLLKAAARSVANPGIRVVATIGGNVVAGGQMSDLVAALVALGAEAEVVAAAGTRRMPVDSLVADRLEPGDLVTSFRVPAGPRWGWRRLPIRGAMDGSVATVAVVAGPRARVVVTMAASRVLRLPHVEDLIGSGDADVREAAIADVADAPLRDEARASDRYRRRVIPVLVERAVADAFERAVAGAAGAPAEGPGRG